MRQVANDIIDTLVKKLPIVFSSIDVKQVDNKTYNAIRMSKKALKRLNKLTDKKS